MEIVRYTRVHPAALSRLIDTVSGMSVSFAGGTIGMNQMAASVDYSHGCYRYWRWAGSEHNEDYTAAGVWYAVDVPLDASLGEHRATFGVLFMSVSFLQRRQFEEWFEDHAARRILGTRVGL